MTKTRFKPTISVNGKKIGLEHPTYFIADIAANHDGDLSRAKELIYLAKESGAHAAKFQHFLAEKIVSDYGFKSLGTQKSHQSGWKKSVFEVYKDYECNRQWTEELVKTCQDAGIDFMTTPYDFEAIDTLCPLIPAIKIGSGDITWTEALERMAALEKPIMLATGASTLKDVSRAVDAIAKHNDQLVLMQCNTNYTASPDNMKYINLNVLKTFTQHWPGVILGLSDHTHGHTTVLGAVALGARVVEKHFTDNNTRVGPDHAFSMTPRTWRDMVDATQDLEAALGDGVKRVEDNEHDTVVLQRRCLRLTSDKQAGAIITADDLEPLRPANTGSILPFDKEQLVGKVLKRDLVYHSHLTSDDFE